MVQNCSYFFSHYLTYRHFSIISLVIAFLFSFYLIRLLNGSRLGKYSVYVFFLGSFLNALDRFKDGCVADYLDFFGLFKYNIPDAMITSSSIILIYLLVMSKHKEVQHEQQNPIS
jgi:lipoprotein signal peptidase